MYKVRWGVIGAGGIAHRRTIPGMLAAKNAELIAIMEINLELAEKLRAKHGARRAYDSVDALLADEEIDAVYIATPVIYHREQVIKAAKAKKHILIEKPVAITLDEAEEVRKVCDSEGVTIGVGFMMRYHTYHQEMKKIVQSGKLGSIVSSRAQLTCWFPDMENNWRQKKATAGGGSLMDMGVHCIDLLQYITGSKVFKVAALTGTRTFKYEVEDSASVLMEFANGSYGYVDANFNILDAAAKCRLEIYGTKGSMLAEGTISQIEGGKLDIVLSDDSLGYDAKQDRIVEDKVDLNVKFGNMYTKEIESFSNAVINGNKPDVTIEEAINIQDIVFKAYESSQKGSFIKI